MTTLLSAICWLSISEVSQVFPEVPLIQPQFSFASARSEGSSARECHTASLGMSSSAVSKANWRAPCSTLVISTEDMRAADLSAD